MAVPAISAEKGDSKNSKDRVILDSTGEDYIVSPWIENPFDRENSISPLLSTQSISQGQTRTHNLNVDSGVNYLEVDFELGRYK